MTRFEKLKSETTLEEMVDIMTKMSLKVTRHFAKVDDWDLEISNFDEAYIEDFFERWLNREL